MIIALTTNSRSRSAKISAKLREALSDDDTLTAGFRYPVSQVARMLGWDSKYDQRGKKLISTIYNATIEYDRDFFVNKMEKLIKKSSRRKRNIIITDIEDRRQVQMLKRMDTLRLIICGDNDSLQQENLIDVYVESERTVEDIVAEIMEKINDHSARY